MTMAEPKIVLLRDARKYVQNKRFEGVICPCCDQNARVYKRRLTHSMVQALIGLYRAGGISEWVHGPSITREHRGEEARLQYWGLIEPATAESKPLGAQRGYWRVTRRGQLFLSNKISVPAYAQVYNARSFGLRGKPTKITDILGSRFSLKKLLADEVEPEEFDGAP
jgi:hypothetical protein